MEEQNNKKQKLVYSLVGIGLVAGIIFSILFLISNLGRISTDDAYIAGRIHSIASKINGTVKNVLIQDNQSVKENDLLLEIDPTDYQLKVNEAQAAHDLRNVAFAQAKRDLKRAQVLYQQEVMPKEKYENVLTAYKLAKAEVDVTLAQLKVALRNLEYTKLYAPANGLITKKSVEIGNQIQAGQPLLAIISLEDIWLVANYKETQLKNVRSGQRVEIKVDTYPGKIFYGRVDSVMAGTGAAFSLFPPENALGNYVKIVQRIPVKIIFDKDTDRQHVLRIGMSATPVIITKDDQSK